MNVCVATSLKVVPSVDTAIATAPVEALRPSPQVAEGSIRNAVMSIGCGRWIVMCLGTNTFVGSPASLPVVLPQPVPWLRSIAPPGPQPKGVKSGPLKSATVAPPDAAAQSWVRAMLVKSAGCWKTGSDTALPGEAFGKNEPGALTATLRYVPVTRPPMA